MRLSTIAMLLLMAAISAACATQESKNVADASEATGKNCVQTIGSSICRKPGSGAMAPSNSISGEELRRAGGSITGAQPGKISD